MIITLQITREQGFMGDIAIYLQSTPNISLPLFNRAMEYEDYLMKDKVIVIRENIAFGLVNITVLPVSTWKTCIYTVKYAVYICYIWVYTSILYKQCMLIRQPPIGNLNFQHPCKFIIILLIFLKKHCPMLKHLYLEWMYNSVKFLSSNLESLKAVFGQ